VSYSGIALPRDYLFDEVASLLRTGEPWRKNSRSRRIPGRHNEYLAPLRKPATAKKPNLAILDNAFDHWSGHDYIHPREVMDSLHV
jgi:hypothetical protein